jgi:hypothetical protein
MEDAMADPIVFPGTVDWSGENPGISLKETPDGPFVTLASFFRVVLSPHGRGHALVLLQSPQDATPPAARGNFCLHDNEPLARYLVAGFVAHFGAFKGQAGLDGLVYRPLDSVAATGDPASSYSEEVIAGDLTVLLRSAAGQVGHRQAPYAEPVRRLPRRDHHGERPRPAGQTRPARDRGAHHHHGDARLLGDLDPRLAGHGLYAISGFAAARSTAARSVSSRLNRLRDLPVTIAAPTPARDCSCGGGRRM